MHEQNMNFSSPSSNLVPGVGQTYWVGSCFFLSAILTTIAFTLSVIDWFRLKLSCNAMQCNTMQQVNTTISFCPGLGAKTSASWTKLPLSSRHIGKTKRTIPLLVTHVGQRCELQYRHRSREINRKINRVLPLVISA